jgi:NAD(P)-dependent dehydrogenase (short-subunit alcohol dehydrogenase family)
VTSSSLEGTTAVITGGNRGIGLGMGIALARAGADVCIWGRDEERSAAAVGQLLEIGVDSLAVRCDVTDEDSVDEAMAATLARFEGIDAFFANAGISHQRKFVEMTLDDWRLVMTTNLEGTFLSLRAAVRHMVARGEGGSLVATGSFAGIHGAPGFQHYTASKLGIVGMMRCLAVELARHRIRCNTLIPGIIDTDIQEDNRGNEKFVAVTTGRTPVRRWGAPEDFGAAAVYLASKEPLFHTGDELLIDGGYTKF